MNTLKHKNMLKYYDGFDGPATLRAVIDQIPKELFQELTGKQLGLVMSAINKAYHKGHKKPGAEVIDDSKTNGAVWVDCLDRTIQWKEVGAKFEQVYEPYRQDENGTTHMARTYHKKVADGELVLSFQN